MDFLRGLNLNQQNKIRFDTVSLRYTFVSSWVCNLFGFWCYCAQVTKSHMKVLEFPLHNQRTVYFIFLLDLTNPYVNFHEQRNSNEMFQLWLTGGQREQRGQSGQISWKDSFSPVIALFILSTHFESNEYYTKLQYLFK